MGQGVGWPGATQMGQIPDRARMCPQGSKWNQMFEEDSGLGGAESLPSREADWVLGTESRPCQSF